GIQAGPRRWPSPPDNMSRLMRPVIPTMDFFQRCRLAAFFGALVLPGIVSAREIIVAPSGGDFAAVAAGVNAAQPGDTVTVRAGIYNEAVSFGRSGSAAAYITLHGEPGAILDGTGGSGQGITINNRNYIRVVGMTVRNFMGSGTPMGISVEGSSSFIELRNILIHNIESPNGNAHGIAFYGSAATPMTNIVVEGNEIRNCRLGQSEALVLNGNIDGFTVAGNTVHDNDNIGIDFIGFEGTGPLGQDQARNGVCVDNVVLVNNTTYQGTNGEIELQYNCDGITIKNNILYARTGQSYISNGGGNNTNVVVDNNVYFGASSTSPGSYPDARARFVNPLLVTPLTDLHLQAVSPAIDAGINLGNDAQGQPLSGASSIDGTPRVHGSAIDIGADEFGAVASVGGSDSPLSPNLMAHARPNP